MMHLNNYHQEGNNITAVKAKRVVVNLFNDPAASNNFAKYYFDEYPELNNKKIVGIKFNAGVIGGVYAGEDFQGVYNNLDNNIGQQSGYVGNLGYARFLYLNLYDKENNLIIQNYPLANLSQPLNYYTTSNNGKILAVDTYLNLKNSYIFSSQVYTGPTQESSVSLTFFYLDK